MPSWISRASRRRSSAVARVRTSLNSSAVSSRSACSSSKVVARASSAGSNGLLALSMATRPKVRRPICSGTAAELPESPAATAAGSAAPARSTPTPRRTAGCSTSQSSRSARRTPRVGTAGRRTPVRRPRPGRTAPTAAAVRAGLLDEGEGSRPPESCRETIRSWEISRYAARRPRSRSVRTRLCSRPIQPPSSPTASVIRVQFFTSVRYGWPGTGSAMPNRSAEQQGRRGQPGSGHRRREPGPQPRGQRGCDQVGQHRPLERVQRHHQQAGGNGLGDRLGTHQRRLRHGGGRGEGNQHEQPHDDHGGGSRRSTRVTEQQMTSRTTRTLMITCPTVNSLVSGTPACR